MFTPDQIAALSAPLNSKYVKPNAKGFDYVEGWHVIAEANRIFGFDGWNRDTVEMVQLGEPEMVNGNWRVAYRCRCRVTVWAGERIVTRDGTGYGSGIVKDARDAHESAAKEAETDAMKRALMTFGNPFGLALYDKAKENVVSGPEAAEIEAASYVSHAKTEIQNIDSQEALRVWWKQEAKNRQLHQFSNDDPLYIDLKAAFAARGHELAPQAVAAE